MSDTTPEPDDTDEIHPAPHPTVTDPAATEPVPAAAPVTTRWWQRRVPLVITGAALLLGYVLGAGAGAIGAFAVNDGHNGGHSARDHRDGGNNGRDGQRRSAHSDNRDQSAPAPSGSASTSPSASSAPSRASS